MIRYISSGESHGKGLLGIIEGFPSNLKVDIKFINSELRRRQLGYGRGNRMKIEKDKIEIISGIRNGITLGSPIGILIKNIDYENWKEIMQVEEFTEKDINIISRPRPGHVDLAGAVKYNHKDIRNVLERASARETAIRVAIGAFAKQLLKVFDIKIYSFVYQIGRIKSLKDVNITDIINADNSCLRVIDKEIESNMIKEIDYAKRNGDTLGGCFKIIVKNVPIGLGSHISWNRKLDAKLAMAIMSIQGIKGVEIGLGFESASRPGSLVHDEIFYDKGYYRITNNAGGIEGGISNGSDIVISAVMKPIPSLAKPLRSVDMTTKEDFKAIKERADVCAVPAASIVAESAVAWTLAEELLIKFGGDSIDETLTNYKNYIKYVNER